VRYAPAARRRLHALVRLRTPPRTKEMASAPDSNPVGVLSVTVGRDKARYLTVRFLVPPV